MSETRTIKAQRPDGGIEQSSIEIAQSPQWRLVFSGVGFRNLEFSNGDLFDAFTSLRVALEEIGVRLLCAGARADVFPSGMSRDMGGGRKGYITKLGQPALRCDLVDIFDHCDAQFIGKVSDQQAFHKKWAASLLK
jgi:hypothetical protein